MRAACCPGWRITSPGQPHEIAGYTDHASALPGTVVRLFVATTAPSFRVLAMVTDRCLTISPPAAEVRVIERATRNIFETFARGPSGRVHPATDFLTGQVSR